MAPGVRDGLGLGEVELPDGVGVWDGVPDGGGLCDGLGVCEVVLCEGLGWLLLPEGVGAPVLADLAWVSLTADTTAADPSAHGECTVLAGAGTATAAASAGASAEPDNRNTPPVTATAARPARTIPIGTTALRWSTRQQPVPSS